MNYDQILNIHRILKCGTLEGAHSDLSVNVVALIWSPVLIKGNTVGEITVFYAVKFKILEHLQLIGAREVLLSSTSQFNQINFLLDKKKFSMKDTLKAFANFKNTQKRVWSDVFWYVKVCIFWKCIQYTIHWDKTQILKKFTSDKIVGTKNAHIFFSWAPTHHSFTFGLRFLHELKHKVRLSKSLCGIFHFRLRFVFIKVYIFAQKNAWTLWL